MPGTVVHARDAPVNSLPERTLTPGEGFSEQVWHRQQERIEERSSRRNGWAEQRDGEGQWQLFPSGWSGKASWRWRQISSSGARGNALTYIPPPEMKPQQNLQTRPALVCTAPSSMEGKRPSGNAELPTPFCGTWWPPWTEAPHRLCYTPSLQHNPSLGDDISMRHVGDTVN